MWKETVEVAFTRSDGTTEPDLPMDNIPGNDEPCPVYSQVDILVRPDKH